MHAHLTSPCSPPRTRWLAPLVLGVALATSSCRAGDAGSSRTGDAAPDLGSTRHAVVAVDTDGGRVPLTFLAGRIDDDEARLLSELAPNVRLLRNLSSEEALARAGELDGMDARYATAELLGAAPDLKWVQAFSAGVDRALAVTALVERDDIVLTNMQGMHGPTIADHVFAMLLQLTRGLDVFAERQRAGQWDRSSPEREPFALHGRRLLVVGLGGIGTEVARRGAGFGMEVWGIGRTARPAPEFVRRAGVSTDLDAWLGEADVVVLCVPLTDETRGLISRERLLAMKAGALLVNIARGAVVDTDALVEALSSGHLGGACLDVTDPEPLPAGHPLWSAPNVVLTPHVAGRSAMTGDRVRDLFRENLRRFARGEPLLNVVDKHAGY